MHWNRRITSSRSFTLVVAVGLAGTMACGVALATGSSTKGFTACSNAKGALSLQNAKGKCKGSTSKVKVGARGEKGAQGAQGVQGIQGEQGIQGIQGVQGDQGPAGVTKGYYDFNDSVSFPALTGNQTVAVTDTLPSGLYLIWAKLWAQDTGAFDRDVHCTLSTPNDSDETEAYLFGAGSGETSSAFPMELESEVTTPAPATVQCNNFDTAGIAIMHVKIMALPIDSVDRTEQ
jgi:hypothetical protein